MKIGITGCRGRMGATLIREISSGRFPALELAGGTALPQDLHGADFFVTADADELFAKAGAVIDFTAPAATCAHAKLAAKHNCALIVGTTGMTKEDEALLAESAKSVPVVYAANMSVGVTLLGALIEQAAARLAADDWDIEVFEAHHRHKVDAPSGTALALGKAAAKGRGIDLADAMDPARHGHTGPRQNGHIGFSVARGGDVVGDHTVTFYGEGERIAFTHIATDRALFARGALRAAQWTKDRTPGLYTMRDVLGL